MKKDCVWVTKEGLELSMSEISDTHLLNIIALLEKSRSEIISKAYSALAIVQGEMSQQHLESDIERLENETFERLENFKIEARKRRLAVC